MSSAATEMKFPARKLLSKLEPEGVQEKRIVLEERRLLLSQICATECEMEAQARTSGLKRKTECVQSKLLNSGNEVSKKRRLVKVTEKLIPAQEKSGRKLVLRKKEICVENPMTWVDGAVKKERFMETRNQPEKETRNTCGSTKKPEGIEKAATFVDIDVKKKRITKKLISAQEKQERKPGLTNKPVQVQRPTILANGCVKKGRFRESRDQPEKNQNTEILLKSTQKDEEKKRILHRWKMIKVERERQKQREAARLALDRVKNTCGFQDNMDSMRDFEKIVGCSSIFYIFSRDRNRYDNL